MASSGRQKGDKRATIELHDWEEWQTFRSDRGTPPWIKVYRGLFTSEKWGSLSDAEKGQLISMWIAAADKKGILSADPRILQKICQLDEKPDLQRFKDIGWIEIIDGQAVDKLTSKGKQTDAPETETETETELKTLVGKKAPTYSFDFLKIWETYRKYNTNKKAYSNTCYLKRKKKLNPPLPSADKLCEIIEAQAVGKELLKRHTNFAPNFPYLSTWINQDIWDDDIYGQKSEIDIKKSLERKETHSKLKGAGYIFIAHDDWMIDGKIIKAKDALMRVENE